MPLELASWIDELVNTNPVGATDPKSEGDDHIRMLKVVFQNQFGSLGMVALINTAVEINTWAGLIADNAAAIIGNADAIGINAGLIADNAAAIAAINAQIFPAGTKMLFGTVPPAGWTVEAIDDHAIRVVSAAPGTIGGSQGMSVVFGTGKSSGAHALVEAEMPSHVHVTPVRWQVHNSNTSHGTVGVGTDIGTLSTGATGGGGAHSHTVADMDLIYMDFNIGIKT